MKQTRKQTTVRLPDYMLADLHSEARKQGTSVSRLIEEIAEEFLYRKPNPDTLNAIEEARSGKEMEELTPYQLEHFEEFVAGL